MGGIEDGNEDEAKSMLILCVFAADGDGLFLWSAKVSTFSRQLPKRMVGAKGG